MTKSSAGREITVLIRPWCFVILSSLVLRHSFVLGASSFFRPWCFVIRHYGRRNSAVVLIAVMPLNFFNMQVFRSLSRDGWLLFGTRTARLFAYGLLSVVL